MHHGSARTTLFLIAAAGASPAFGQVLVHERASESMPPAPAGPTLLQTLPTVAEGPFVSVQLNTAPGSGLDVLNDAGNEPSIARSATDPDRFIVGWRQFDSISSSYRKAGYAYSLDGGNVWSGRRVLDESRQGSDPILVPGPDGEIYYNTFRYANFPGSTEVYSTTNGGQTWSGPFTAFGGDKAWMACDLTDGPNRGAIYQFWTNTANVSFDGGQTWSPSGGEAAKWGTMTVGPDGRCYNSGRSLRLVEASAATPFAAPTISGLNGLPYKHPIVVGGTPVNPAGIEGQNNVVVNTAPGDRYNEVYVLQSSFGREGAPSKPATDIYFAYSTDLGDNFSDAIRVNDDPIGTAWHWLATFSVAPNGRLDAVWYDTREDPNPTLPSMSRLYASYSTDGGRAWSPDFPVSPAFDHGLGYPSQGKMGDYITMVSDDLGAHIAYTATFTGGQDVYYLHMGGTDCDANGVPDAMEIAAGLAPDADGDGTPDACACAADFTGDGDLNVDDIDAFVAAFIAGDLAADLDASGSLNVDDIDAFVAAFLAGCA
ncbi:MAG: hypothetical protein DHS20C14_14510 [Phycisphaeraceae bacterium]|nr:MAG: hypothetical protein DHS20C14_14510 [Phycisphaeraceae bacterium]